MSDAADIAQLCRNFKTGFMGLSLTLPVLLNPRLHILDVYTRYYGQTPESPLEVLRDDKTIHSDDSLGNIFKAVVALPGGGFGEDLLPLVAMHGAIRLGDELIQANLITTGEPLLQFARPLRNACAHGNRWHFVGEEPKHQAVLRGRVLDASLHGSKALYGSLAPGDYLDYLDDLAALLDP